MSPRTTGTQAAKSSALKPRKPHTSETVDEIWAELYELLEDYGPIWYTEELHNRATRALSGQPKGKRFSLIRGRTRERRLKWAVIETATRSQSGICAVPTADRSSFPKS